MDENREMKVSTKYNKFNGLSKILWGFSSKCLIIPRAVGKKKYYD
jgi:hypothetical protein